MDAYNVANMKLGETPIKDTISSSWHPVKLLALFSIWMATLGNIPLWLEFARLPEMNDWRAVWFILSFAVLIAALLMMVMKYIKVNYWLK